MLALLLSSVCFVCFFLCFAYELHKLRIKPKTYVCIAMLLALPAWDIHSIVFAFEIHFIIFYEIAKLFTTWWKGGKTRVLAIGALSLLLAGAWVGYGFYNMKHIVRREYVIQSEKQLNHNYTIAVLSDLHYPTTMNKQELAELVQQIQREQADIVLLCGDIVDEYTSMKKREEVFSLLEGLCTKSDVFYVFGNHDTGQYSFQNAISKEELRSLIEAHHIRVLEDEVACVDDKLCLVGRDDYRMHNRKSVATLLSMMPDNCYKLVVDHQPRELEKSAELKVDLHISGHTHAGQLFPLYYIFECFHLNELNYGKETIAQMEAINTSGAGGWGFAIRSDHHSEYVILKLQSTSASNR